MSARLQGLLAGAAFLALYSLTFWIPFAYDDVGFLLNNTLVTGPWPGFKSFFLASFAELGEYEPLNTLGHWALYRLADRQVFLYRLTSVLIHAANSVLAYRIFRKLLGDAGQAFSAALLFALYPPHAELMALSSFKKHLGVSFFALCVVNLPGFRSQAARCLAGAGLMALGLSCKESALLILPFAALVGAALDPAPTRAHFKRRAPFYASLAAVAAAYAAARYLMLPRAFMPLVGGGWETHLLTSAKLLLWYAGHLVWPSGLCLEHSILPVAQAGGLQGVLIAAGAAGLSAACVFVWRWDRIAGCGLAWCLLFLTPFLNIVPYLNYSLVADRYLYFASAGFFLAALRVCERARLRFRRPAWTLTAVCALVAGLYFSHALAYLTRFHDPLTLWAQTARCAPLNPRAQAALGSAYLAAGLYPQAERHLLAALRLAPGWDVVVLDLAAVHAQTGRLAQAVDALERMPKDSKPAAWRALGVYFMQAGRWTRARDALERAERLDPRGKDAALALGHCYLALGLTDSAQERFESVLDEPGQRAKALGGLGDVFSKRRAKDRAVRYYEDSLAADPTQGEVIKRLARLYVARGEKARAERLYDQALDSIDGMLSRFEGSQARSFAGFAAALREDLARDKKRVLGSKR